jgi:hypothetical protein
VVVGFVGWMAGRGLYRLPTKARVGYGGGKSIAHAYTSMHAWATVYVFIILHTSIYTCIWFGTCKRRFRFQRDLADLTRVAPAARRSTEQGTTCSQLPSDYC